MSGESAEIEDLYGVLVSIEEKLDRLVRLLEAKPARREEQLELFPTYPVRNDSPRYTPTTIPDADPGVTRCGKCGNSFLGASGYACAAFDCPISGRSLA